MLYQPLSMAVLLWLMVQAKMFPPSANTRLLLNTLFSKSVCLLKVCQVRTDQMHLVTILQSCENRLLKRAEIGAPPFHDIAEIDLRRGFLLYLSHSPPLPFFHNASETRLTDDGGKERLRRNMTRDSGGGTAAATIALSEVGVPLSGNTIPDTGAFEVP